MPKTIEKPYWSSDGKKILFLSRVKVDKEQINHKSDVKIVKHLWYKFTTTGWFHDTRKHLFVVDSHGGRPKQLTTGEFDVAAANWFPDSDQVGFGTVAYLPSFWALPSAFLTSSAGAAAVGFINCTASIGGFFGPKIIGDLSQRTGSFHGGFLVMIACWTIASLLVLLCPRERSAQLSA